MPRKKPFSGKQKKLQLQDKRTKKDQPNQTHGRFSKTRLKAENEKMYKKGEHNPGRYKLNFLRETAEEIAERKETSQKVPIEFVDEKDLEISIEQVYPPDSVLEMPKRPKWTYLMSKQQLEQQENGYFTDYLAKIHEDYEDKQLSYFEHNLETWRQAWRVLERSDIVVMVTDVRHPVLHFSPALYDHVTNDLKKPLILVLNKIDLVPANVIAAWTEYFKNLYPKLQIVWFTAFPRDVRKIDFGSKLKRRPQKKRVYQTHMGPRELFDFCKEIVGDEVDLSSWKDKINKDLAKLFNQSPDAYEEDDEDESEEEEQEEEEDDMSHMEALSRFHNGILTVGFLGHPNVGKSSLMNGLIGKKVVSTSVTPGHTKYYQTYFLTKTVRLCDSPGLVFPSLIDKQMQILSGIYPIAQVQEPYTSVGYLAARIPLVQILKLVIGENYANPRSKKKQEWTAWAICEAWAIQKGYYTAKAARPDVYRGANSILRMAVDGRLCLYMRPPEFSSNKDKWDEHELTTRLLKLRVHTGVEAELSQSSEGDSSDDEDQDAHISLSNPFAQLDMGE